MADFYLANHELVLFELASSELAEFILVSV